MSSSVEVQLVRVVISDRRHQQTIHLRERDGERQFSILIGINEAEEIHRKLRGYKPMRPMTHDLVVQLLEVCGGVIERIVVSDLRNGTFFASIVVKLQDRQEVVDARPSDAIALAVQVDAPIFVETKVFEALDRGE
ncbi:MAG: bifunctional nuclease family protein [Planctomycetes bacterium]|nr:bifunctional nuclease family protein [Planctomycetota bacterium]